MFAQFSTWCLRAPQLQNNQFKSCSSLCIGIIQTYLLHGYVGYTKPWMEMAREPVWHFVFLVGGNDSHWVFLSCFVWKLRFKSFTISPSKTATMSMVTWKIYQQVTLSWQHDSVLPLPQKCNRLVGMTGSSFALLYFFPPCPRWDWTNTHLWQCSLWL